MNKIAKQKLANLIMIAGMSISFNILAAPIVFFDFDSDGIQDSNHTIGLNENFTVDVYVTNVDNVHGGLISWGAQVDFDNVLLTANSFTINPAWPLHGVNNKIDNANGKVELLASTFSALTGTQALFSLDLTADAAGVGLFSMQELFPDNLTFTGFAGADGFDYDSEVIFSTASLTVTAVPVMPAVWLFFSGLVVLAAKGAGKSRQV